MGIWARARVLAVATVVLLGVGLGLGLRPTEPTGAAERAEPADPSALTDGPDQPRPKAGPLAWAMALAGGGLLHTAPDDETLPAPEATQATADACPPSPGPLALLATMSAEPAEWSMAIVADGGRETRLVKEGQALADYTVHSIARERLGLARGGRHECVALGSRRAAATGAPARVPAARTPEIRALGQNRYVISQRFVRDLMDQPESVAGEARAVPRRRDGRASGFELVGVRHGGLLGELGVRSGDVLVGVDGTPVRSANDTLKVYARLLESSHLSVELERNGRRRTLEIDLQLPAPDPGAEPPRTGSVERVRPHDGATTLRNGS